VPISKKKQGALSEIRIDRMWPVLSPAHLALLELRRDPYFDKIPEDRIPFYIEEAIRFGQEAAQSHASDWTLKELINRIIRSGVRVRFADRHPEDASVRAQYTRRPATIDVYRSSLDELREFFSNMGESVPEEELIRLHLFHEWFHHLEEKTYGRTDLFLPKVVVGRRGPFSVRKPIYRTREIAAHAFTQEAMVLEWSPSLIDQLISLARKGWSKSRIREHFHELKRKADALFAPPAEDEAGKEENREAK
jgi:hypothetical protein